MLAWDKCIGNLFTGCAVSGVEMARARFRLSYGTVGTCDVDAKGDSQAHQRETKSTDATAQGRIDP
jgi:hypothetical protein